MDTEGQFAPTSDAAVRERYETLGPVAQTVVREVARAMDLSAEEYDEYVSSDVVETAREVLFAGRLAVHLGTRGEFEGWLADRDREVVELGSEHVDNVVWHDVAIENAVLAATYQNERGAAVQTLRRQAFGRYYEAVV
ncbi:MAG: DUF5809 family protein [Haloarculaceae archaeon]